MIYDSSGSVIREILPSNDGSSEISRSLDQQDFQKNHGYYGDTCNDDLGGITWKEYEGIYFLFFVYMLN